MGHPTELRWGALPLGVTLRLQALAVRAVPLTRLPLRLSCWLPVAPSPQGYSVVHSQGTVLTVGNRVTVELKCGQMKLK